VSRAPILIVGLILIVAGVVFSLQGFNVMTGSGMSGSSLWEVLGPLIAVVGIVLVVRSRRA
jgi:uncharacterized RDD family membrane protein YckC